MNSRTKKVLVPREKIYAMLTKEDKYASQWGESKSSLNPAWPAHMINRETGEPFSLIEFLNFAELYLRQAKDAHASFCPDIGAVRIRLLKAASLLVTALQVHGEEEDLDRLAGQSSSKFPVLYGGIETLKYFQVFPKELKQLYTAMKTPQDTRDNTLV